MSKKRWVDLAKSVLLPVIVLLVVAAEDCGYIDELTGLSDVEEVADRFSRSYAPDASKPVYPEDAAWKPTVALIKEYTKAKLRTDMQPQVIARFQASLSTYDPGGNEWTSPSTSLAVLYRRSAPNSGVDIPKEESTIVGSIGDLHSWINQSKSARHFIINDMLLSVASIFFGFWVWRINHLPVRK